MRQNIIVIKPKGMIYMCKNKNKKPHPSGNAFLTNPVASANEFTGYGAKMPLCEEEADELSEMFEDIPTEPSRMGVAAKDKRKTRNTMP